MSATWATIVILLVGVLIVVGGVLVLRLHAFLALILAALVVSALTNATTVTRYALDRERFRIAGVAPDGRHLVLQLGSKQTLREGTLVLLVRPDPDTGRWMEVGSFRAGPVLEPTDADGRSARQVAVEPADLPDAVTVDRRDVLILPAALIEAEALAGQTVADRVAFGFGSTAASIGILIAMASIIGKCLLDSGGADKIVRRTLGLLGEDRAPVAFLGSGFLLGIPVFFDTVFYLMIPLGKAMRLRTGRNYLLYVLTIVAGATMAHSLVPPTPGPLFVAEALGVSVGAMMLAGTVVGLCTVAVGFLYAKIVSRIWDLPLRESPDCTLADLDAITSRQEHDLPPLWLALTPILLPVFLIGGYTILEQYEAHFSLAFLRVAETLGDKNIALVLAAAVAMAMLVWQKRASREDLAKAVQSALASGGIIILITAAGGAFGEALKQTGIAGLIRELTTRDPLLVVLLAFVITTAVRTAQGSATVAMITAVGILAGLAGNLGFHPVYLALAIGCGSKPLSWMNDSGFWVITKMSGMTEGEGLKYITPMTALMGVVGLLVTMLGVKLWPHPFG